MPPTVLLLDGGESVGYNRLELTAVGFLDLSEEVQEKFVKLAIQELQCDAQIVAHDAEAAKVGEESAQLGKKIIQ